MGAAEPLALVDILVRRVCALSERAVAGGARGAPVGAELTCYAHILDRAMGIEKNGVPNGDGFCDKRLVTEVGADLLLAGLEPHRGEVALGLVDVLEGLAEIHAVLEKSDRLVDLVQEHSDHVTCG